jgi:ATPase subunit of ABC transporter with duplicated ATPase domains
VGTITLSRVAWSRPGGAPHFDDVSFHVGDGDHTALIGANGVGKSTLVRIVSGEVTDHRGTLSVTGSLGVMPQLVGSLRDTTVHELFVSLAPPAVARAAARLTAAEAAHRTGPADEAAALAYATAIAEWGEAGGYDAEVFWDACCTRAVGGTYAALRDRPLGTFSGGEQKRLALEALLRGPHDVLVLDEPDNFLDVPGKRWLEAEIRACPKTILFVSHDRELLAAAATRIVTVEASGAWTHGGGYATYHDAQAALRAQRIKDRALYEEERARLEGIVAEMRRRAKVSDTFAPKLKAAESRLRQFDDKHEAPELVAEQRIDVRLRGARTGKRALAMERLELHGLTDPFDAEVWFGERVAVLGPNGAGKSHFLRLLAGDTSVDHDGRVQLGARVVPGLFNQTHRHPDWQGVTLLDILHRHDVVRGPAMGMLRRYDLQRCAEQHFETLSGGQQARFQILLLEVSGATLLLLDEPTDNLDLVSAEALEAGLAQFEGTVVAVTHDRWFLRGFDRFLLFEEDCTVRDLLEPPPLFAATTG